MKLKLVISISAEDKARMEKIDPTSTEQVEAPSLEVVASSRKVLRRNRGYKPSFKRAP